MLGRSVFVSSLPFAHGESITRFWLFFSSSSSSYERKYPILKSIDFDLFFLFYETFLTVIFYCN